MKAHSRNPSGSSVGAGASSSERPAPGLAREQIRRSKGALHRTSPGIPIVRDDSALFIIDERFLKSLCGENRFCLKALLASIEKSILAYAVERAHGNQKKAALLLGINYTTLNWKIKRYGIPTSPKDEKITLF